MRPAWLLVALVAAAAVATVEGTTSNRGCGCISACSGAPGARCDTSNCGDWRECNCGIKFVFIFPYLGCDACYSDACTLLTVNQPLASQRTALGGTLTTSWTNNNAGSTVALDLFYGWAWVATIHSGVVGAPASTWTVPHNLGGAYGVTLTSDFAVRARSSNGLESWSARFIIHPPTITPLAVTPADGSGGSSLVLGARGIVQWASAHLAATTLRAELLYAGVLVRPLGVGVAVTGGSLSFTLPSSLGADYGTGRRSEFAVRLTSEANPLITTTTALFSIVSGAPLITAPPPTGQVVLGNVLVVAWSMPRGAAASNLRLELRHAQGSGLSALVLNISQSVASTAGSAALSIPGSLAGGYGAAITNGFFVRAIVLGDAAGTQSETQHTLQVLPGSIRLLTPASAAMMTIGVAVTISWASMNVAGTVTIALYHAEGRVCREGVDSGGEVCTEGASVLVDTLTTTTGAAHGSFTWAIPPLFSSYWGSLDGPRSDFFFRVTSNANPAIAADTSHDLNLNQQATSATSTIVIASRGTGAILTVPNGACACRSGCTRLSVTATLAGGPICKVDANCTERWGFDHVGHHDWVGRCSAGVVATVPTTANRTRPIPLAFTVRVASGDISSWSVRLARCSLLGDTPLNVTLSIVGVRRNSLSVDAILPPTMQLLGGFSYCVRYSYVDAFGQVYDGRAAYISFFGAPARRPTPSYNPDVARLYWQLAAAANDEEDWRARIQSWSCTACNASRVDMQQAIPLQNQARVFPGLSLGNFDISGYAARTDTGAIVLSFRGTEMVAQPAQLPILDGLCSLVQRPLHHNFAYSGCQYCYVHSSFYASVVALGTQVLDALAALGATQVASGPSVYLTGHSLGAAIAQIFAYELALAGFPVEGVWTFGSPRVGNRAFAESYESVVMYGSVQADSIVWGSWGSSGRSGRRVQAAGAAANGNSSSADDGAPPSAEPGSIAPRQVVASAVLRRAAQRSMSALHISDPAELESNFLPPPLHSRSPLGLGREVSSPFGGALLAVGEGEGSVTGSGGGGDIATAAGEDTAGVAELTNATIAPVTHGRRLYVYIGGAYNAIGSFRIVNGLDVVAVLSRAVDDVYQYGALVNPGYWHPGGEVVYTTASASPSVCMACPDTSASAECRCASSHIAFDAVTVTSRLVKRILDMRVVAFATRVLRALMGEYSWMLLLAELLDEYVIPAVSWLYSLFINPVQTILIAGVRAVAFYNELIQYLWSIANVCGHFSGDVWAHAISCVLSWVSAHTTYESIMPSPTARRLGHHTRLHRRAQAGPAPLPPASWNESAQGVPRPQHELDTLEYMGSVFAAMLIAPTPSPTPSRSPVPSSAPIRWGSSFTGLCLDGSDLAVTTTRADVVTSNTRCVSYSRWCNGTSHSDGLCSSAEIDAGTVRTLYMPLDVAGCDDLALRRGQVVGLICCRSGDLCNNATAAGAEGSGGNSSSLFSGMCWIGDDAASTLRRTVNASRLATSSCLTLGVRCGTVLAPAALCSPAEQSAGTLRVVFQATDNSACDDATQLGLRQAGYINPSCCQQDGCNTLERSTASSTPSNAPSVSQSSTSTSSASTTASPSQTASRTSTPSPTPTSSQPCPAGWTRPAGSTRCYVFLPQSSTWGRQNDNCAALWPDHGGTLAVVTTRAEAEFVLGPVRCGAMPAADPSWSTLFDWVGGVKAGGAVSRRVVQWQRSRPGGRGPMAARQPGFKARGLRHSGPPESPTLRTSAF